MMESLSKVVELEVEEDVLASHEEILADSEMIFEILEERAALEVHGACACTTSCKCSSCSCIVWF